MIELIVSVRKKDGEVLEELVVNGDYLKPAAVYPEHMLAQCIKEVLEENFDVEVKK